jgi:hypothetical protein
MVGGRLTENEDLVLPRRVLIGCWVLGLVWLRAAFSILPQNLDAAQNLGFLGDGTAFGTPP